VDLAPTICDLLEVPRPATITPGRFSYAATGLQERREFAVSVALGSLPGGVTELRMSIRDRGHRYELSPAGPVALYDLTADPTANLNLIEGSPEISRRLHEALRRWDSSLEPLPGKGKPLPGKAASSPAAGAGPVAGPSAP